jgi:hypothetical protein
MDCRDDGVYEFAVGEDVIDADGEAILGEANCYGFPSGLFYQHPAMKQGCTVLSAYIPRADPVTIATLFP